MSCLPASINCGAMTQNWKPYKPEANNDGKEINKRVVFEYQGELFWS
jgi:hypothetical protein